MPQSAPKQKAKPTSGASSSSSRKSAHSSAGRSKAGTQKHRTIQSKNARIAKQQKAFRKGAASLTSNLEKKLADRAGYTEIVGGKGKGGGAKGAAAAEKNKK